MADGIVDLIETSATKVSGIQVSNLFSWNSITLRCKVPRSSDRSTYETVFVEYVHVDGDSICVKRGDFVQKGQLLCRSGDFGFCPEPHLHFQCNRSNEPTAQSAEIHVLSPDGKEFSFKAGTYYDSRGESRPSLRSMPKRRGAEEKACC